MTSNKINVIKELSQNPSHNNIHLNLQASLSTVPGIPTFQHGCSALSQRPGGGESLKSQEIHRIRMDVEIEVHDYIYIVKTNDILLSFTITFVPIDFLTVVCDDTPQGPQGPCLSVVFGERKLPDGVDVDVV